MGLHSNFKAILSNKERTRLSWLWWYMPIIPRFRRERQEAHEFKESLVLCETLLSPSKKKKKERIKDPAFTL